jgi:hypothetical protein
MRILPIAGPQRMFAFMRSPNLLPEGAMQWTDKYKQVVATRLAPIRPGQHHTLPGRLVISVTSHPRRFHLAALSLRSLLQQDVAPDLLTLWVPYDDYEHLPRSVTRLQYHGLVIKQCADVGRYNAIVPALEAYPNAFIVTAGDTFYYPSDWLRRLVQAYRHPREVLCRNAKWAVARDGAFAPYAAWQPLASDGATGPHVFFRAAGGVLFPPGSLARRVTDEDRFTRACPCNPDIWLNWMAGLAGSSVRLAAPVELMTWPDPLAGSPRCEEGEGKDDRAIAAMIHTYGHPQAALQVA